ncbi:MAG: hypothetical protein ABFD83_14470 [Armatimonadota bacterium]
MIEIRNLTFQPLALHLAGDAGGIHLRSREIKAIAAEQFSDEIRMAAERGFVSISDVPVRTQPDPRVETANNEHIAEPMVDQAKPRKRRER